MATTERRWIGKDVPRLEDPKLLAGRATYTDDVKLPGTLYWVDLTPPPEMNSVPVQGLFADGGNSRIAVQPCLPASAPPPTTAATGPAATRTGAPPNLP